MFGIGEAPIHYSLHNLFWDMRCSGVECLYFVFFINIIISVILHHDNHSIYNSFLHHFPSHITGCTIFSTDAVLVFKIPCSHFLPYVYVTLALHQTSDIWLFSVGLRASWYWKSRCPYVNYPPSPLDKMAAILADDNLKCIFLNENDRTLIQISLKFVPRSPIDNNSALVQVMAWRRTGDKPFPELMLTHICGTMGRRVNSSCSEQSGSSFSSPTSEGLWL